jgi:hypothetical protein
MHCICKNMQNMQSRFAILHMQNMQKYAPPTLLMTTAV